MGNLLVSVNGSAPTAGGVTVAPGDTVALSFANSNGWRSYRLEMLLPVIDAAGTFASVPAGWTDEGNGIASYSAVSVPPPAFTMPGVSEWGKRMLTLTASTGLVDTDTALSMPSVLGLVDVSPREAAQFDVVRQWGGALQRALRAIVGGIGGGIPAMINVDGAVPVERAGDTLDDAVRVERRLRFMDIDPDVDFRGLNDPTYTAAKSFASTPPWQGGPDMAGTSVLFVRRGTVLTNLAIAADIVGDHVAFSTGSYAATYANGAAPYANDGAFVPDPPNFESATFGDPSSGDQNGYAVLLAGNDADPDPSVTITFTGEVDINFGTAAALTRTWQTGEASKTVVATSDVYVGTDTTDDVSGINVWEGNTSPHGFASSLQQNRALPLTTITVGGTAAYVFFLWPHQAQYTNGSPGFGGAGSVSKRPSTVSIARNGVTRTYDVWRSDSKFPPGSTLHVQTS
jgi:hypothetical protein